MKYWNDDYLEWLTEADTSKNGPPSPTPSSQDKKTIIEKECKTVPNCIIIHFDESEKFVSFFKKLNEKIFPYEKNGLYEDFPNKEFSPKSENQSLGSNKSSGEIYYSNIDKDKDKEWAPSSKGPDPFNIKNWPAKKIKPRLYYCENIRDIENQFLIRNGFKISKNDIQWLYANGKVGKNWNKSWGSEVMQSVADSLRSYHAPAWQTTGDRWG